MNMAAMAAMTLPVGTEWLEIGTWKGDSAIALGHLLKPFGGKIYCVDHWMGSPGTDLEAEASGTDVFAQFMASVRASDLEDVCIPIKMDSRDLLKHFAARQFTFVWIDGDHRHSVASQDITNASSLVVDGGVLMGHDCEFPPAAVDCKIPTAAMIGEFPPGTVSSKFLDAHAEDDCVPHYSYASNLHCGVVKAVSEIFPQARIANSMWSVIYVDGNWQAPELPHGPKGVDVEPPKDNRPTDPHPRPPQQPKAPT